MLSLIADDTFLLKNLELFLEPVEVYDGNGKLVGLFVPANLERCKEKRERALAQIDWAEVERRRQNENGRVLLQDCLVALKKLEAEVNRRQQAGEKPFTTEEGVAYYRKMMPDNVDSVTSAVPAGNQAG